MTLLAKLIEWGGWFVVAMGCIAATKGLISDHGDGLIRVVAIVPGLAAAFGGLLAVCFGQLTQVFIATEENVRAVIEQNKITNAMLGEVLGSYRISLDRLASSVRPIMEPAGGRDGEDTPLKE